MNFPFRFAIKACSSKEQEAGTTKNIDTESTLELLRFPDNAVHGWKITPLRTPPVVCDVCVHARGRSKQCLLHISIVSIVVCESLCLCLCLCLCLSASVSVLVVCVDVRCGWVWMKKIHVNYKKL